MNKRMRVGVGVAMAFGSLYVGAASASTANGLTSNGHLPPIGNIWAQVDVNGSHSCGIHTDGSLWCWGYNSDGELGVGDNAPRQSPTQVGTDIGWLSVRTGDLHTCAIRTDPSAPMTKIKGGTLWCWGANADGQLGVGDTTPRNVPTQVGSRNDWASVTTGGAQTCALRIAKSLWCWGSNSDGQLGVGDQSNRLMPTHVGPASWQSANAGSLHTCGIQLDGSLWCWGANADGELGLGDTTGRLAPSQVEPGTAWRQVALGGQDACAIESDGTLWCWGYNLHGELGVGDTNQRNAPTQVGSATTWETIGPGNQHTCATRTGSTLTKPNVTLWCWGWNRQGQLGTGDLTNWVVPVQVVSPSTGWVTVGGGDFHTCGLLKNHTVWCWGYNASGQLGLGDTQARLVPTQV